MYCYDSRKIKPGDVFLCLPGGDSYIPQALEKGAVSYLKVTRAEMAELVNKALDFPSRHLTVIGITGTNGKTTVCHLITEALKTAGYKPSAQGTLTGSLTTPESLDTLTAMRRHLDNGGTHFVMEVSSHAIHQQRIAGIEFDVKVLTNITHDHLDYHGSFEEYRNVKLSFMKSDNGHAIYPEDFEKETIWFSHQLKGTFNELNLKAAIAVLHYLKVDDAAIEAALSRVTAPSGRFELIDAGQPFLVVVDFAHTPDGLENVLKEARILAEKRGGFLRTLFGCGGDRDKAKRPVMGHIASSYSDYAIIAPDNPRTERLESINEDIIRGISVPESRYEVINDREEAIRQLIMSAHPNDVLVIAGKGHESYQILNSGTVPFSDQETARKMIKERLIHESVH